MLFYEDLGAYQRSEMERLRRLDDANIPARGVIAKVLLPGPLPDQTAGGASYAVTHAVDVIQVDAQGLVGDRHRCRSRPSGGRESSLYPRGTTIRQHRHLCIVSAHDCRVLSEQLGVPVTPELLGANIVIDRSDGEDYSLSELPRGTHLLVVPADAASVPRPPIATIVHGVKQHGCGITGRAIADQHGDRSLVRRFQKLATGHRGIICSVEYPVTDLAEVRPGLQVVFRFPTAVSA